MSISTLEATRIKEPDIANYSQIKQITKRSKQKEAILKALKKTPSHPTAAWIYDEVRKELPHISLATVYRNLRLLRAQGEILGMEMSGTCRFDANTNHHYHGMCDRCGQVFDIDKSINKRFDWEIDSEMDFTVSEYKLEFRGLCRECQAN